MHGWVVAFGATAVGRPIQGGFVSDALTEIAALGVCSRYVLQTGGNVSAMLVAGALVLVLGLAAVAVWQGHASRVLARIRQRGRTADGTAVGPSDEGSTTETIDPDATSGPAQETEEASDKELILDILEDNDGRTKQARIVDATGWSKSKVSMRLSEMEEDGHITKLRVGRENIISLEGKEPEAADSPFESR